MADQPVPSPAVRRLSVYLRQLERLAEQGLRTVASRQLAESLHAGAAQVRKDLAYFGQFGQAGVGYRIGPLIDELRRILGTDRTVNVIVVGAGDLGRALLRYKGFRRRGFQIVAAFDVAEGKVSRAVGTINVYHIKEMPRIVHQHKVRLAVLAVPASVAQDVADQVLAAGVKGILNFAPTPLQTPDTAAVVPVDLSADLEQLNFRVSHL